MKKLVTLFFILLPFFGFTQITTGTLKVHVVDENGEDFLGANVGVFQGDKFIKGNASDPFGLATIANLEPSEYRLEISYVGYETEIMKVSIYISKITSLKIELKPSKEEIRCTYDCFYHPYDIFDDFYGGSTTYKTDQILKMPVR